MRQSKGEVRIPTQARAQRTRATLVRAAQAQFSAHGYSATTAKSIAEAAGVATGSFYQYFTDKDAVLRELATLRVRGLAERLGHLLAPTADAAVARNRLLAVVEAVAAYYRDDRGLHAVVSERRYADPELGAILSGGEAALVEDIRRLLCALRYEGDVDATALTVFRTVEGVVRAQVLRERIVSDERCYAALIGVLVGLTGLHADTASQAPRVPAPAC
ncbi:MAG: TetR family transcriptional regulator [Myxococcales bacterium]|nr:TetR family transcriptional regulator [Myxococcales bacterium]